MTPALVRLVPLTASQILKESDLPIKMVAFGHCFRTEAGAAGAAGKGLYRVHQFSKVWGWAGKGGGGSVSGFKCAATASLRHTQSLNSFYVLAMCSELLCMTCTHACKPESAQLCLYVFRWRCLCCAPRPSQRPSMRSCVRLRRSSSQSWGYTSRWAGLGSALIQS
jgi:hypothetical protein